MGIREWMKKRKIENQLSDIRRLELDEVNLYMEKVYNPFIIASKPKYRSKNKIPEEKELIRLYVHRIYNPPIHVHPRYKKDHTLNEYTEGEI